MVSSDIDLKCSVFNEICWSGKFSNRHLAGLSCLVWIWLVFFNRRTIWKIGIRYNINNYAQNSLEQFSQDAKLLLKIEESSSTGSRS